MSIILKGIDLPKEGEDITLEINHKGEVRVYSTELKETNTNAEAIQIPKGHGRIIDESEATAYKNERDNEIIVVATTILEAEE